MYGKRKSRLPFIHALGMLQMIWMLLMKCLQELGGLDEDLYRLARPEGLPILKQIARTIVDAGKPVELHFQVTIDYDRLNDRSFEELRGLVGANHLFDCRHFPLGHKGSGKVDVDIEFVHFNQPMNQKQVLAAFDERGLERPDVEHFLVVGMQCAEALNFPLVVLLGKPWKNGVGLEFAICYNEGSTQGAVNVTRTDTMWSATHRFMGIRAHKPILLPAAA